MILNMNKKIKARERRHRRVRKKIFGTPDLPRLNVFKSNTNIYAQIIDDLASRTMVSASSLDKGLAKDIKTGGNIDAAKKVGQLLAKRALEANITKVVFDRGGYIYHGKVKALADSAREIGLVF